MGQGLLFYGSAYSCFGGFVVLVWWALLLLGGYVLVFGFTAG